MSENRVAQTLGIEKPVVQAAMTWITDAKLVAAVSNAGGMGVLAANAGQTELTTDPNETAERMRQQIQLTKTLTNKPFAVNFLPTDKNLPASFDFSTPLYNVIKEEGGIAAVVMASFSLEKSVVEEFHDLGIKILYRPINPSVENCVEAEKLGVDMIIATGEEEGATIRRLTWV